MILRAGFFLKPENEFYWLCDILSFLGKLAKFSFSGIGSIERTPKFSIADIQYIPEYRHCSYKVRIRLSLRHFLTIEPL